MLFRSDSYSKITGMTMIVPVKIERVTLDTSSNRFVVILKDEESKRWLPIVVGPAEAQAIALKMENVNPPRPMTHDLIRDLLVKFKAEVKQMVVTELKDNTYYAILEIIAGHKVIQLDSRPSDALAISLRTGSPIYVHEKVMKQAAIGEDLETFEPDEEDAIKNLQQQMQEAVKEERYEDAAKFRDMIHDLKEKIDDKDE